jgi:endo-1,4-beta-xylanase
MVNKKILKIITACILIITVISVSVVTILSVKAASALIVHDFEDGLSGWVARGTTEIVELSTEEANSGTQSVKISERTATWNGATVDVTDTLSLGVTYTFGVYIKYVGDSYSGTQNFSLQLQYNDGVSDNYMNINTAAVTKGNWTYLEGDYTVPTDATNVQIYVESQYNSSPSEQDLMDFYIDDFTATPTDLPDIQEDIESLKDVYSDYFILGGAGTASEIALQPSKDLFNKHYNSLTPGNELKPDSVLDYDETIAYVEESGNETNPQVNLRKVRTLLEFARDNDIPVRGHTLVWHNQTPDWFFREGYSTDTSVAWVSKEVMLQRLENYIKNVMELIETDYPEVEFYAWDVVNEAVDPSTSTGMRNPGSPSTTAGNSLWMETIGEEYIVKAFEYAREYAPDGCKLFYNDYNEYESTKMNFILGILEELKAQDLVDGMGMQSHWTMDYPTVSMVETAVRNYTDLGLEVQLTEVDMKQPDGSDSALESQATRYNSFMSKIVELREEGLDIGAVIFWGVTDETSWLGGYPLLFDADYQAKPAFYSVVEAAGVETTTSSDTTDTTDPTETTTSTATATPTSTSSEPTSTSVTNEGLTVTYNTSNSWGSGATIMVTVTNEGDTTIDGWEVTWTFPNDQTISTLWSGIYTQDGADVTVTNEAWNGSLASGSSTTFGFNVTFTEANDVPSNLTVN